MQPNKNNQSKSTLLSILGLIIFSFLAVGSLDDTKQPTEEETEALKKKIQDYSGQSIPNNAKDGINEDTIKKYLIGKWLVDSVVTNDDVIRDNIQHSRDTRLRTDGYAVIYFKSKYAKYGDHVGTAEFKNNREYLETAQIYMGDIGDSINWTTRKEVTTYEYRVLGSYIISTLRYGENKQNKIETKLSVIKINKQNLAFKSDEDGVTTINFYTRVKEMPDNKLKTDNVEAGHQIHVVEQGQTLYRISIIYGVSVDDLKKWNNLSSNDISTDQNLIIMK